MALPADFPTPPRRPPATQPLTNPDGTVATAWLNYFDKQERYNALVRKYIDGL